MFRSKKETTVKHSRFSSLTDRISKREFLKRSCRLALSLAGTGAAISSPFWFKKFISVPDAGIFTAKASNTLIRDAPEARYYLSTINEAVSCIACHGGDHDLDDGSDVHGAGIVKCLLCAQNCVIEAGERGKCKARENVDGKLKSLVYGRPVAIHVDPIEKKPFYHFMPGSQAFSLATSGCPLSCKFCQNWEISQARPEDFNTRHVSPEEVARASVSRNAPIVAFTYNEPTVFTEYMTDIARIGKEHNLKSVLISCGFMNGEPLEEMCNLLDAIKIDLKGFSEDFYRNVCGATLSPVLRSIRQVARSDVHLEIVNLVVPTLNDSDKMLSELCKWVMGELGPDVPVHFTRFHPDYRMLNLPPTPVSTLEKAYETAKKAGLRYPYVGNFPGHPGNHTYCPGCGRAVIERTGFFITGSKLDGGRCMRCNQKIAGVFV